MLALSEAFDGVRRIRSFGVRKWAVRADLFRSVSSKSHFVLFLLSTLFMNLVVSYFEVSGAVVRYSNETFVKRCSQFNWK